MEEGDRLVAAPPPHDRVHGAALDRAGPDQRDLDREVVEPPRQEAGQQPQLRPRLHLEDPDRVRPAQLVVDALLLLRDRLERPPLAHVLTDGLGREVEGVLQRREHAEPEQVELHEPHVGAVVLVPLQHGPVLHAGVLDRHDLADGPVGEHHAAGVDAEVPRRLQQLLREVDDRGGDVVVVGGGDGAPALHLPAPRVLLPGGGAERLRHVAHRVLRPVGDHVRDLRRVPPPVEAVDVLDHLLPPVRVEVDVDVRLLVAEGGEEALERQVEEDRVDRGDGEQVADGGVRGRAAALAEDALRARERRRCRAR